MQLTVRDAARLFSVPERAIYKWIDEGTIPFYLVNEQYRFNHTALLEWASARKMRVSGAFFDDKKRNGKALPTLVEAFDVGGIHYDIKAVDRESALRAVVKALPVSDEADREFLLQVLLAREASGSTGIGEGIAIPHARNPVVLNQSRAAICLCFLERPVEFGAIDGKNVHTIFSIISPTIRIHLHLLARLASALHDEGFRKVIAERGTIDQINREVSRIEANLPVTASEKA
jgi:PTS system nitrogen regulatory IIA component